MMLPPGLTGELQNYGLKHCHMLNGDKVEGVGITPRTTTAQPATPATPPPPMASAETPARLRRNRKLYAPETRQWD